MRPIVRSSRAGAAAAAPPVLATERTSPVSGSYSSFADDDDGDDGFGGWCFHGSAPGRFTCLAAGTGFGFFCCLGAGGEAMNGSSGGLYSSRSPHAAAFFWARRSLGLPDGASAKAPPGRR